MAIYQLGDDIPNIPDSAYFAAEATVIGKVTLGDNVGVWPGVVMRGDNDSITLGNGSNVQDNAVLHTDPGFPLLVGENVTVGHQAALHGCTIGDGSLIGIQAVGMNGAVIGKKLPNRRRRRSAGRQNLWRAQGHPRLPRQSYPRTHRRRY